MLGFDGRTSELTGLIASKEDHSPCSFCISLEHIFVSLKSRELTAVLDFKRTPQIEQSKNPCAARRVGYGTELSVRQPKCPGQKARLERRIPTSSSHTSSH